LIVYRYHELRAVHLEMTSRCNLVCPQCARNFEGGFADPNVPLDELTLDDVRAIFPRDFVAQLRHIYLCGNYGDAMVARDTLPALAYLREASASLALSLHTNGSGRDDAWWSELGRLGVEIWFGIDGLADTNHLYRRGADFERVMRSVRAFVGAGGRAHWMFIVFHHNEHQVEAARALSRELGFVDFTARRTHRFHEGDRLAVVDRDGRPEYWLELPHAAEWQNAQLVQVRLAPRDLDTTPIACDAVARKGVYVSAEGLVFPCCHTAHLYTPGPRAVQLAALLDELPGGRDAIDARRRSLAEIIEGPLFQRALPDRWARPSVAAGRLAICAQVCGRDEVPPPPAGVRDAW
jgi:MoaA/NifB/PqqE/SkfB family radical SAM enzyme